MFGIIQDGTYRVENIGYSTPTLTEGYVVGVRPIKREADVPTLGTLFGRWTASDGTVYWDEVEVIPDLHTALTLAAERGELAIWDLAHGVEVPTTAAAILDADEPPALRFRIFRSAWGQGAYAWLVEGTREDEDGDTLWGNFPTWARAFQFSAAVLANGGVR